jgi:formamidopyrimidine-DNA glycosylase
MREGFDIPELPEVETIRLELEPWLYGRTILSAKLVEAPPGPKYANLEQAASQRITAVTRRGKFLLLPLSGGNELIIHLGMTGVLTPCRPGEHLRVQVTLDDGPNSTLYFRDPRRFGRFLVVSKGDYRRLPTLQNMGPEPLGDTFTKVKFAQALARSGTPIKSYLLTQRPVAGLGNIYADEALWRARVHPLTPARSVPPQKIERLQNAIKDVLTASLEAQGTTLNDYRTVNGNVGTFLEELNVYGHSNEPCPRCGSDVQKITLAGRGTHFCPNCQKART